MSSQGRSVLSSSFRWFTRKAAVSPSTGRKSTFTTYVPVNYLKNGKDPELKPLKEYPDWIQNVRLLNLTEIKKKGYENLTLSEKRRHWQLIQREKIKERSSLGEQF
eukprot:238246_1